MLNTLGLSIVNQKTLHSVSFVGISEEIIQILKIPLHSTGFTNFRKSSNRYKEHHTCSTHKTSTELYLNRLAFVEKSSQTISSQLDSQHKKTLKETEVI